MSLLNDFFKFAKEQGISEEDIYKEKGEGYTIVSFGEQGEEDVIYNISLILYDDNNTVEIYIRKQINVDDLFDVLKRTNNLNAEYMGVAFFVEDGIISTKSVCSTNGDIEIALKQMVQNMQIAASEFVNFRL